MAQQQALFAVMAQQHADQEQRYTDIEEVLNRTAKDLDQLREEHQKAIDELRLFRRWVYGSRRNGTLLMQSSSICLKWAHLFAEPEPSTSQSSDDSEVPASAEDTVRAAVAKAKAALRQKKRADRKLCLDALPQVKHHHDVSPEEKVCGECKRDKTCIGEEISRSWTLCRDNWRFTTII